MESDKRLTRRQFLKLVPPIGLAFTTACRGKNTDESLKKEVGLEKTEQSLEETQQILKITQETPIPIITQRPATNTSEKHVTQTSTDKATSTPAEATLTNTPTAVENTETVPVTPTPEHNDQKIIDDIRDTSGGEKLNLENSLISYVVKIPRPFTDDAVYGVLAVNVNNEEKGMAVIDNFDCGLEQLQNANKLGSPIGSGKSPSISGLWKPNVRFENVGGTMFIEPSLGTIAVITGTSYQFDANDQKISCPKDSVFSGAGKLPEILAREAGKLIRTLLEGFKEGYFEENK